VADDRITKDLEKSSHGLIKKYLGTGLVGLWKTTKKKNLCGKPITQTRNEPGTSA
jgi:hypothetical protein